MTIDSDYYPGGHYIDDGGEDQYDDGNYIGVPSFTANYVTYLENCEAGLVDGSLYSMAMNNSAISCTVFLDYPHSSISIEGEFGYVVAATTGSYQFNQWKGFWKISQGDDEEGIIHHLWVTNSPTAEHVPNLHDMEQIDDPDYDVDLVVGLKGYHVVYNMWITYTPDLTATPDDVIKQLVRAVADALGRDTKNIRIYKILSFFLNHEW